MGIKWLSQYSMSDILQAKNIVPSNTQKYSLVDINNAIKEKLGVDPVIECKKEDDENFISEIRICFTKDLEPTDCDGVVWSLNFYGQTILSNCDKSKDITYPHYISNSLITQLHRLIYWLQWFTL
ncbi:jg5291 [Pararge aegeria aegeria]|uniref:Jg5291 protein n=3 Tax=Pararge aegeria TaxID=116150 RepID=A0A8S4R723_9NEOP|nr:jg5291 [Pararge aegeria aegeria]